MWWAGRPNDCTPCQGAKWFTSGVAYNLHIHIHQGGFVTV